MKEAFWEKKEKKEREAIPEKLVYQVLKDLLDKKEVMVIQVEMDEVAKMVRKDFQEKKELRAIEDLQVVRKERKESQVQVEMASKVIQDKKERKVIQEGKFQDL